MFGREKPAPATPSITPSAARLDAAAAPATSAGSAAKIETVLGPNCRMSGVLQSDGGIRIEGMFEGQIHTAGNLIVAESARVAAEIQAYNVVISGQVKGNVTANRIEITETGKVFGDLNVNILLLSEGAFLRGQTNMAGDAEPPLFDGQQVLPPRSAPLSGSASVVDAADAE
ncbi:MAG: polymer-forming cytoskeletal protein [Anaerolineae bacterium]|nr:polymer-forming cytoskeletal protein [Thermoflexales bacterium]MDW8408898.1 polymer-forming cytoskeletal protein [Anaerolineae bacterium]